MRQKTFIVIIGSIILVFLIFFVYSLFNQNNYSDVFIVDAIYYDEGYAEIIFNDNTKNSTSITLEVLGMKESYQKIFFNNSFIERIDFLSVPTYGWKSTPVIFVVDHGDFGKIGIKTEIRPFTDPYVEPIFSLIEN